MTDLAPPSRIPPGFPLRYTRSATLTVCGCCGSEQRSERLIGFFRATTTGPAGQLVPGTVQRPLGASEVLYLGIPIETTTLRVGTPLCPICVDRAFASAVPIPLLPEPTARLNWLGGRDAREAGDRSGDRAKPRSLDDILL